MIYLQKSNQGDFYGLFYELKITCIMLAFGLLNMLGVVPAIGAIEKLSLIKIIFSKDLVISKIIFIIGFTTLVTFAFRLFRPMLGKYKEDEESELDENQILAKDLDSDSILMLTGLVIILIMIISIFI